MRIRRKKQRIVFDSRFSDIKDRRFFTSHKPKFSHISLTSQTMRIFWYNKKNTIERKYKLSQFFDKDKFWFTEDAYEQDLMFYTGQISEEEFIKRDRNRRTVGEHAILARKTANVEARKLESRQKLEEEVRELNELLQVRAEQKLTHKQRKMGIKPYAPQIKI